MTKSPSLLSRFMLCCLLTCPPVVLAEEENVEDIRWYQVEIILFTQNDKIALSEEQWKSKASGFTLPDSTQELYLGETSLKELPIAPVPFSTVLQNETSLNGIANRLSRSNQYQSLIHLSWIQPTRKDVTPIPVHVGSGIEIEPFRENEENQSPLFIYSDAEIHPEPSTGFNGTVGLQRGHYLHLQVDMVYREANREKLTQNNRYDFLQPENDFYSEPEDEARFTVYRMKQKRRLRSGETHYFDHPRFGLIAKVTPIELPEPEVIEPIEPEITEQVPEVQNEQNGAPTEDKKPPPSSSTQPDNQTGQ